MKIIHQNGYSKGELMLYRLTVIKNVVDSAQALVLALRKYMLEPEIPDNRVGVRSHKGHRLMFFFADARRILISFYDIVYMPTPILSWTQVWVRRLLRSGMIRSSPK